MPKKRQEKRTYVSDFMDDDIEHIKASNSEGWSQDKCTQLWCNSVLCLNAWGLAAVGAVENPLKPCKSYWN